jgi:N-acetyl-anhydromuramyl-L-alanine amidase AmpD
VRKITHLVVHCTGAPGRTIDDIRRFHTTPKPRGKGWSDIGYHFVYHEDGSEHTGRRISRPGAGVAGFNAATVHLCCVGNGDAADFNEAQYAALTARLSVLCKQFGLDAPAVIGHRETVRFVKPALKTKKSCPGRKVDMEALRDRVSEALHAS